MINLTDSALDAVRTASNALSVKLIIAHLLVARNLHDIKRASSMPRCNLLILCLFGHKSCCVCDVCLVSDRCVFRTNHLADQGAACSSRSIPRKIEQRLNTSSEGLTFL